jgi:hypothetical protein
MYTNKHIIRKAFEGYFYNTYERLQDYKAYTIYKYDITLFGGDGGVDTFISGDFNIESEVYE